MKLSFDNFVPEIKLRSPRLFKRKNDCTESISAELTFQKYSLRLACVKADHTDVEQSLRKLSVAVVIES